VSGRAFDVAALQSSESCATVRAHDSSPVAIARVGARDGGTRAAPPLSSDIAERRRGH
jgi:hypothetical protein